MSTPRILRCPGCGAELSTGPAGSCSFCGAHVELAPETRIVERIIVERIERVVMVDRATAQSSLECPRCSVPLFEGESASTTLHGCGSCGGIWMDNATSQRVVGQVDTAILILANRAAVAGRHGAQADATTPKGAPCPVCKAALARTYVGGVELDVCATHGTWFDRSEVQRVSAHFEAQRSAVTGGPTYDYEAAARARGVQDRETYARGALELFGAVLDGVARS